MLLQSAPYLINDFQIEQNYYTLYLLGVLKVWHTSTYTSLPDAPNGVRTCGGYRYMYYIQKIRGVLPTTPLQDQQAGRFVSLDRSTY